MSFIDKKLHINEIVLKAKIGQKDDFIKLRRIYGTLQEQIFKGFCESYPFLKTRRMDIFREFYFFFWEAINTYDFNSKTSFSYHLKESLIQSAREIMCTYYGYDIENIVGKEVIKSGIIKQEPSKNRKLADKAVRMLTPKKKFVLYLHCYRHLFIYKCRDYTKTSRRGVENSLYSAYKTIREGLIKVKVGKVYVRHRERIHKIYQEKI